MRGYLLARAQDRAKLAAFSESDGLKSLREEIFLTRMMIENLLVLSGQSDVEQLAVYGRVNSHMLTLEKLVKSCNQIEEKLGNLLSKPTLIRVGQAICGAITRRLDGLPNYEQIVDPLIADIIEVIQRAQNEPQPPALMSPSNES